MGGLLDRLHPPQCSGQRDGLPVNLSSQVENLSGTRIQTVHFIEGLILVLATCCLRGTNGPYLVELLQFGYDCTFALNPERDTNPPLLIIACGRGETADAVLTPYPLLKAKTIRLS